MLSDWQVEHFQGLDGHETFQVKPSVQQIHELSSLVSFFKNSHFEL